MNKRLGNLVDLDRLIHEPGRLAILALLSAVAEADFLYLLNETGLTKGNLGSHLAKLEAGGYVNIEKTYPRQDTPDHLPPDENGPNRVC